MLYVTYIDGGILKKGVITEDKFRVLSSNPQVNSLHTYPSPEIMESAYTTMTKGAVDNKKYLKD